jgi:hypothetical protein
MARKARRSPRKGARRRKVARPGRRRPARRKPAARRRRKGSARRRRRPAAPRARGPAVWSHLKQERLLDVRLRDLEVRIEGTGVEDCGASRSRSTSRTGGSCASSAA